MEFKKGAFDFQTSQQNRLEEVQAELEKLRQKEYNIKRAFYQKLPVSDAFEIIPEKK